MTGFLTERGRLRPAWGPIAVVLAFALTGGTALGQGVTPSPPPGTSRPLNLQPPTRLDPPNAATTDRPSSPTRATAPGGRGTTPGSSVSVGALRDVHADSAGTLSEADGAFPPGFWRGTPRTVIDALLPALPVEAPSPAMHRLTRRLLLSAAEVPEGDSPINLLALRAELLARLGEPDGAANLLELAGDRAAHPKLARLELDARLNGFNMERSCQLAAAAQSAPADGYWQQTMVFCQALARQRDQAALGVALLRERKQGDPAFFDLMDDLNGLGQAKLDGLTNPSALTLAMARAAQASLPPAVLKSDSPSLLRFVALDPGVEAAVRLDAAERAEASGVIDSATLRDIYANTAVAKEQRAKALSSAEADGGPLGRAILYQTAVDQAVPAVRAETLSQAFRLADKAGRFPATARAFLPLVAALPPGQDLLWFAPEAARAMLVADASEGAGPWLALLRTGADAERQKRFQALLPLARLAGLPEAQAWDTDVAAWRKTAAGEETGYRRAVLLYSLLDGLGDGAAETSWTELLRPNEIRPYAMPAVPVWYRLERAAADKRLGETVVLALIVLGKGGPQDASPLALRAAIQALQRVGEEKAARAVALEAAVAGGL